MNRRVITGFDADGKASIISDAPIPVVLTSEKVPGYEIGEVCMIDGVPAHLSRINTEGREWQLEPPPGAVAWRVVVRPPESGDNALEGLLDEVGAQDGRAEPDHEPGRGGMHTTATVDLLVILSGEVWLAVGDDEEVLLKPGDCILQGGVPHAWHNRSTEPCVMAGVMMGAVP